MGRVIVCSLRHTRQNICKSTGKIRRCVVFIKRYGYTTRNRTGGMNLFDEDIIDNPRLQQG